MEYTKQQHSDLWHKRKCFVFVVQHVRRALQFDIDLILKTVFIKLRRKKQRDQKRIGNDFSSFVSAGHRFPFNVIYVLGFSRPAILMNLLHWSTCKPIGFQMKMATTATVRSDNVRI